MNPPLVLAKVPFDGPGDRVALERVLPLAVASIAPAHLASQRWFGAKGRAVAWLELEDFAWLENLALLEGEPAVALVLSIVRIGYEDGGSDRYSMPMAITSVGAWMQARQTGARGFFSLMTGNMQDDFIGFDALSEPSFPVALYRLFETDAELEGRAGRFRFRSAPALAGAVAGRDPLERVRPLSRDQGQSNSSLIFSDALILKLFRRLEAGVNPDLEVTGFLTLEAGFQAAPPLAGWIEYLGPDGSEPTALGILQTFVPNEGGAWERTLERLSGFFGRVGGEATPSREALERLAADSLTDARELGAATGAMHAALASSAENPAFAPGPITAADSAAWQAQLRAEVRETAALLRARIGTVSAEVRPALESLLAREPRMLEVAGGLGGLASSGALKTRFHGDYHLGQVLATGSGFVVLDFEGEPLRPLAARRARQAPLKDVAGMLRSLSYAAAAGLFTAGPALEPWADAWLEAARERFVAGYRAALIGAPSGLLPPPGVLEPALRALELEKALYELRYELDNRPQWLPVPLRGIERLLD